MRPFALAAAGVLLASMVTPAAAEDHAQATALFTSQKCILCHSIAGKGNPKGALDDVGRKLKADEIRQWIVNPEQMREKTKATRLPAMKQAPLTKDQVDALVAFLQAQKVGGAAGAR